MLWYIIWTILGVIVLIILLSASWSDLTLVKICTKTFRTRWEMSE